MTEASDPLRHVAPATHPAPDPDYVPYDKRKLSYAGTFTSPVSARCIRSLEWMTGKITLLRRIRRFEREGVVEGNAFWERALRIMRVDLQTPAEEIARIPRSGPVVVVANHPHGLVDGMVIAALLGRVREDYKILSRSLLTGVKEVSQFLISVPFPHEEDSHRTMIAMRQQAMDHLRTGGVVALFPSGSVAHASRWFGPAVEADWNPFTASLIRRSGATVLPMYFPGQNSRWYQIAAQTNAVLRQGLLLHEVVHALDRPQKPRIGAPIPPEELAQWKDRPGELLGWLRERTLSLKDAP